MVQKTILSIAEIKPSEETAILKYIRFGEWAAHLVIVEKRRNKIRICGDFKVGVNLFLEVDQYTILKAIRLYVGNVSQNRTCVKAICCMN